MVFWQMSAQAGMREIARACSWDFGRDDGSVIARNIDLAKDGELVGYNNPNEHSWEINGGDIVFLNKDGKISTRFDGARVAGGNLVLYGRFRLGGNITHTLTCR